MRFQLAVACAALVSLSCASGDVRLEHYRAAYSTHFQGVPDQAEACALLRNKSARPVEWIELRLRTRSHFGGDAVIRSKWIYRGHVAPGATLAVRFVHPPIADEIAVGFGRTGTLFACEQGGIRPDFMCLSKGLTGGYLPLSAVMTTEPVYAAFYDEYTKLTAFLHSHSFTGNPLSLSK